jgi:two-component system nitrate/nitrite response regulator NarL
MRPQPQRAIPTIMMVADNPILRRGVASLLRQAGFHVVAESASAADALGLLNTCVPTVIIADAHLAGVTGVLLADVLKRSKPRIKVVLLSHDRDDAMLIAAATAGVKDLLTRDADANMLCTSIRNVLHGERPVLYRVADRIARHADLLRLYEPTYSMVALHATRPDVTAGELLALDCLVRGFTITEAAKHLNLAPSTVKNRLQRLRVRHGLHSQTQLLRFSSQQGWITPVSASWAVGT